MRISSETYTAVCRNIIKLYIVTSRWTIIDTGALVNHSAPSSAKDENEYCFVSILFLFLYRNFTTEEQNEVSTMTECFTEHFCL